MELKTTLEEICSWKHGKRKHFLRKGNGGETLEAKHMLYYFPLILWKTQFRLPAQLTHIFFLRNFAIPQVTIIKDSILPFHNTFSFASGNLKGVPGLYNQETLNRFFLELSTHRTVNIYTHTHICICICVYTFVFNLPFSLQDLRKQLFGWL